MPLLKFDNSQLIDTIQQPAPFINPAVVPSLSLSLPLYHPLPKVTDLALVYRREKSNLSGCHWEHARPGVRLGVKCGEHGGPAASCQSTCSSSVRMVLLSSFNSPVTMFTLQYTPCSSFSVPMSQLLQLSQFYACTML